MIGSQHPRPDSPQRRNYIAAGMAVAIEGANRNESDTGANPSYELVAAAGRAAMVSHLQDVCTQRFSMLQQPALFFLLCISS